MTLLYFAWVRARIGRSRETLGLPDEVIDVASLLEWLVGRGENYRAALSNPAIIRVAVNQQYVERDHALVDGDEVALFPPVTGG